PGADCKCFLAGTKVLMGNRTTRNIEDIKTGDQVFATDPLTGRTAPRQVTRTIATDSDRHFNELTIATPNGPAKLTATHEHPFWVPDKHRWLPARELTPGTTLRTSDGTTAQVKANHAYDRHARTYNLTVDTIHTYYVLAGATPVLVHNSNCPIGSVTGPAGEVFPLPKGAAGTPVATGKGWVYDIPTGTKGLDPRVVQVRVMDPVTTGKHQYPNGYVVYMNKAGQSVNPLTGQTVSRADPYNHIRIP
ncbi:polymorphic toxin-type HINT domain-containing protein, partial [Streptomyces sp. I05A-00742]|uniref:polymorphic toxin-type HINT domain-containing protein n=1 Tax=Streptomyces sp. I05A-00742 TaxID=2732853 RepID=UPI002017B7B9